MTKLQETLVEIDNLIKTGDSEFETGFIDDMFNKLENQENFYNAESDSNPGDPNSRGAAGPTEKTNRDNDVDATKNPKKKRRLIKSVGIGVLLTSVIVITLTFTQ